jgi:ribosome recycling factor
MEFNNLKKETEDKMKQAILALTEDFKKVRTGRAQVSMLEGVKVEYYGNLTPLNQVASVSCPDARSFLITPWETSVLKSIESSIVKSDIGMAPINDGKVIRLKLPELTEERRKDLVKKTKKMVEDARVAVRMARRDANDLLKQALKDKTLSEDENKSHQEVIQKMTDQYIADVDKIAADKEKDIMTL